MIRGQAIPIARRRAAEPELTLEGISKLLAKQTAELQRLQKEEIEQAGRLSEKRTLGLKELKDELKNDTVRTHEGMEALRTEQGEIKKSR